MALNIGELVAYISVNSSKAYSSIAQFEGRMGAAAKTASQKFQNVGSAVENVGGNFSSAGRAVATLTSPIGGAALAAGGLTAALGWGRLQSLDTAKAQMRGLGYSTDDVNRITGQLTNDLSGGMMTMAEGTFAAANGMAAGVKEGKELTKYVQLMDSAVVAGSGSFDEMNKIFGQTADLGHLTATNFDMMTERLPAFSANAQEHFGVGADALRNMLNDGEVSMDDFLAIIDDGYGGMAEEIAGTWEGMAKNVKNWVGIIGEALLGGVFEQSKDSIEEFIGWLQSDEVQKWASEASVVVSDAFGKILDAVKTVITWFANLPGPVQKFILVLTGIAVAAGPVLVVMGTIISSVGTLISSFGMIIGVLAKIPAPLNILGGLFRMISPLLGLLKGGIMLVSGAMKALWLTMMANPIVLIIAAVVAIVAALVWFFTQTETGKEIWANFMEWLGQAWEWIKETAVTVFNAVVDAIVGAWEWIQETSAEIWNGFIEWIVGLWNGIIDWATSIFQGIVDTIVGAWEWIQDKTAEIWDTVVNWIRDNWDTILDILSLANPVTAVIRHWDKIKAVTVAVWDWVVDKIKGVWTSITTAVTNAATKVGDFVSKTWDKIKTTTANIWNGIKDVIGNVWNTVNRTVQQKINQVKNIINNVWRSVKSVTSNAWNGVKNVVSNGIGGVVSFVSGMPGRVLSALGNIGSKLYNSGWSMIQGFKDGIVSAFNNAVNAVQNGMSRIRNFFPFSPAKEGPFSGKGYTIYSGQALTEDFAKGMSMAESDVVRQAEAITKAASFDVPSVPGMTGPGGSVHSAGSQATSGVTNNFTVVNPVAEPTSETARKASAYIGVSI